MPLDKTGLKTALKLALEAGAAGDKDAVAQAMVDAIEIFVKSGTITTTVTTITACSAGPGTGTGSGSGSIL